MTEDYKSLELRIMAHMSDDDDTLYKLVSNVQDCYVYEESDTGLTREEIKRQAFMAMYGTGRSASMAYNYRKVYSGDGD